MNMMSDLISRQSAISTATTMCELCDTGDIIDYRDMMVESLKVLPSAQQWIPVTTRPMNEEERKHFSETLGFDVEYEDPVMFECKMPDDGQEILVSYYGYVCMDKCEVDEDCYYGLEENGDWYGVTAWMPLPKPYKGERKEE